MFHRALFVSRLLIVAAAFAFISLRIPALAFDKPAHAHLPDFDKRPGPAGVVPEHAAAAERLKERLPHLHVDYDRIVNTPKMVLTRDGFLSGPRGRGRGV